MINPNRTQLVAILRGVLPDEATEIGAALIEAGISQIEVPLNSPDPFTSIAKLVKAFGDHATIGGGTVLEVAQVDKLAAIGADLVVSPNADPSVIARSKNHGMISFPGVKTATECFAAIKAGADGLKIFPANQLGQSGLKALRSVLPKDLPVLAVGGIDVGDMAGWIAAGATGFGIGSTLYKPGQSATEVGEKAREFVKQLDMGGQ